MQAWLPPIPLGRTRGSVRDIANVSFGYDVEIGIEFVDQRHPIGDVHVYYVRVRDALEVLHKGAERTVRRALASLKEKGRIRREGSDKNGRWVIVQTERCPCKCHGKCPCKTISPDGTGHSGPHPQLSMKTHP